MIKNKFEKKLKQSFDLEVKDYLEKPENYDLSNRRLNHRFPTKTILATLCSACVILVIVINNNNASKAIYNSMGAQGTISSSSSAVASSSQDSNYVYYELDKVEEDEINNYAGYELLPLSLNEEYSTKELYSLSKNDDIFEAYQVNIRSFDEVKKITLLINKDLSKQEALKNEGLKETIINGVSVIFYEYDYEQKYSATFIVNNISFEAIGYDLSKEEFSEVIKEIVN